MVTIPYQNEIIQIRPSKNLRVLKLREYLFRLCFKLF